MIAERRQHIEIVTPEGVHFGLPLAGPVARLLALADVYDALRRRRLHKPALSHPEAVKILLEESPGQFDPLLMQAFDRCAGQFDRVFREIPD